MPDRRWFGDLGLAILIAMPVASLALPLPNSNQQSTSRVAAHPRVASKTPSADRIATSGRISLLG